MADTQEAVTLLRYQIDQSSITSAINANASVSASIQDVGVQAQSVAEQLAAMGIDANQVFTTSGEQIDIGLTQPLDNADASVQSLIRDIGNLGRDIESIPEPDLSAFGVAEDTAGGDGGGGSGFGNVRALRSLGSLAGGDAGGAIRDVANIVRLTSVFGPLGLAAGGAALLIKNATDAEAARAKAAQDTADTLNKIATGAAGGTTSSIQQQIQQEQAHQNVLLDTQKTLQGYDDQVKSIDQAYKDGLISTDEYHQTLTLVGQDVDKLTGGMVTAAGGTLDLNAVLKDNQTSIDTSNQALARYNVELGTNAVKTNDAAAALDALSKKQEAGAAQALQIDQLTTEQLKERAASDLRQIDVLTRYVGANNLTGDALQNVADQITALNQDYGLVSAASGTFGQQLLDEATAISALTDAGSKFLDEVTKEVNAQSAITQTEQQIAQLRADAAAKELSIEQDGAAQIASAEEQAGEKRAEIVQNYQDAIAKIMREEGQALFDDVASRDALKYRTDKQNEQNALADQKLQEDKDLAQNAQSLAQKEQQIKASEQKQIQTVEQGEQQQLNIKDQALQQEQTDLLNIKASELAISQEYGIGIQNSFVTMMQGIESIVVSHAQSLWSQLEAAYAAQVAQSAISSGGGSGGFGYGNQQQAFNTLFDRRLNETLRGGARSTNGGRLP